MTFEITFVFKSLKKEKDIKSSKRPTVIFTINDLPNNKIVFLKKGNRRDKGNKGKIRG